MRVAIQDSHETFAVPHQLPDASGVEGGLVTLDGVRLGEEAAQRARPIDVERPERRREQAIEVEPVERPLGLLDQLDELAGIGHGDDVPGVADARHVHAPDVSGKVVVGVVRVESLPGAVRRVVVAEALGRARPGDHETVERAVDDALHLQRTAVSKALGILRRRLVRSFSGRSARSSKGRPIHE
jgi:hypothetical protein